VDWVDILREVMILGFYAGVVGVVAFARMVWVICGWFLCCYIRVTVVFFGFDVCRVDVVQLCSCGAFFVSL
jgi:apolipoprotein N-acyltransferase